MHCYWTFCVLMLHLRHCNSRDWIQKGKAPLLHFYKQHIKEPVMAIVRHLFWVNEEHGMKDQIQLSKLSLMGMLLSFMKQTGAKILAKEPLELEMYQIFMSRLMLKLDLQWQSNAINLAVLAALPALLPSLKITKMTRGWLSKNAGAKGRRERARLLLQIKEEIILYQVYLDKKQEIHNFDEAFYTFGKLVYSLDRLYHHAIERRTGANERLQILREAFTCLERSDIETTYKLSLMSSLMQTLG